MKLAVRSGLGRGLTTAIFVWIFSAWGAKKPAKKTRRPAPIVTATGPEISSDPHVNSPHARVKLIASTSNVVVGDPLQIGLYFEIDPEWHIYWKNPGDSGTPLRVEWRLPTTAKIAAQKWPIPQRLPVGPLANYGYEGSVLIPFDLQWTKRDLWSIADQTAVSLSVEAQAEWLICRVECLPASARFHLQLPIDRSGALRAEASAEKYLFDKVQYPNFDTLTGAKVVDRGSEYELIFTPPEGFGDPAIGWDFFSADELRVQPAVIPTVQRQEGSVHLSIVKDVNAPVAAHSLSGLVLAQGKDASDRVGFEITADVSPAAATTQRPLGMLLFFAFLGGLILNIMPCVFPVLSIKILSFVHEAGAAGGKSTLRKHGWVFALGVLVSFWALAGLLLVLRQSGQALGWGFQLQSPLFVSALAILFILIGLNFIGYLNISFSGGKLGSVGAGRPGYTSSFLSGILATVVATPCTAPFMGVALGAALTLAPPVSVLIFSFLGIGMAAPYVVLSHEPRLLSALPRPGAWMETFRQFLAFPIFATALWLLWVLSEQSQGQVIVVLLLALLLAFWIWLLKLRLSKKKKLLWSLLCVAAIGPVAKNLADAPVAATRAPAPADGDWRAYRAGDFAQVLATSDYVFVDFTASWCITCQVNKKIVLNTDEAKTFFASRRITTVRADWTHQDPQITRLLESVGRSSVPTYAIFHRSQKTFALLPEILTPQILRDRVEIFMQSFDAKAKVNSNKKEGN